MSQLLKLILPVMLLIVPLSAQASEFELLKKSYLKLENILDFMEYSSAVEVECASVNSGRAYKNWLMFNISKLTAMTKIQKAYQLKVIAVADDVGKNYFAKETKKRQKMVSKAVNIIASGSTDMQQRLCGGLQEMVVASDGRTKVDADLDYLVRNKKRILGAIANNANW